jgi:hypothetical protein
MRPGHGRSGLKQIASVFSFVEGLYCEYQEGLAMFVQWIGFRNDCTCQ